MDKGINILRDEFLKKKHDGVPYLAFSIDPKEGKLFKVDMFHPDGDRSIILSHELLDLYIYSFQDMKQRMELIRSKNDNI